MIFRSSGLRPYFASRRLHVGVERLAVGEPGVPREDDVGVLGRELAAAVGVARLDHDRVALRADRRVEGPLDVELVAVVLEPGAVRVPQLAGHLDELGGALVAVVAREEAGTAEVLTRERVGRGDRVPRGAAVAEMVEGRELAGELVRLVERGVQRGREPDTVGDGCRARRAP